MSANLWDRVSREMGKKVGQLFRGGAYRLLSVDFMGFDVEWTKTGKRARVWRTLVEKTAAKQERGEAIPERSISYTVIIEFFVREALAKTVAVIACAQEKGDSPAPAKELYSSSTFRMARRFAESCGREWLILSGLHGVLSPEVEIAPYDSYLPGMKKAERQAWAERVASQLEESVNAVRVKFVVIAGQAYRAAFEALQIFGSSPITWECPVAGMEIGEIRSFLKTQTEKKGS